MKTVNLVLASAGFWVLASSGAFGQTVEDASADCALYGSGYHYLSGHRACVKLGVLLRGEGEFYPSRDWRVTGKVRPDLDIRWESNNHGTVRAFFAYDLFGTLQDAPGMPPTDTSVAAEETEAYIAFDPLLLGLTTSTFDYGSTFTYVKGFQSDAGTLQARLTWLLGEHTVSVALEDRRDRDLGSGFPAAVIALSPTATMGFIAAAAVANTPHGMGYAGQLGVEVPVLVNASVRAVGAIAHNAQSYVGLVGAAPGLAWSGTVSGRFALLPGLNVVAAVSVADGPTSGVRWEAVGGVHFVPLQNLEIGAEAYHRDVPDSPSRGILVRAEYDF
jgi:hypothetical protein